MTTIVTVYVFFSMAGSATVNKIQWFVDSGASEHIVNDRNLFTKLERMETPMEIAVVKNGESVTAKYSGTVVVNSMVENRMIKCTVKNVLYVPEARCNLFSVRKVESAGMTIVFENAKVKVFRNSQIVAVGNRRSLLYELEFYPISSEANALYTCGEVRKSDELWHRRYGHLSQKNLLNLVQKNMVNGFQKPQKVPATGKECDTVILCESCIEGKQARKPFKVDHVGKRSSRVLELIHTDVCGPITPVSRTGKKYFVSFIDDWSRFVKVYPITSKSEVLDCFEEYVQTAEAKFDVRVSRVRCDNGGEYRNARFDQFCRKRGIQVEFTVPYTPEQNGVSERMNRTLVERARSMLICAGIHKVFWAEAVMTAAYLVNRSPARALRENATPYHLWTGEKPDVSGLRVFGCPVFCHVPKELRRKLDGKSWKGIFVGYAVNGYRVYDPRSKKIVVVRDVIFDEKAVGNCPTEPNISYESHLPLVGDTVEQLESTVAQPGLDNEQQEPEDQRSSLEAGRCDEDYGFQSEDEAFQGFESCDEDNGEDIQDQAAPTDAPEVADRRVRSRPVWHKDYIMDFAGFSLSAINYVDNLPDTLEGIMKRDDWVHWQAAVNDEMESLQKNQTWTLVKLPKGKKPISCKWVFKIKPGSDGEPNRYKARLVARGFSQRYGFDYTETYAPVARLDTLRTILAVANHQRMIVHQMDVKCAFLNGRIDEEIFMSLPEGFQQGNDTVCRLNRSIYGLKQASRAWNERFHKFVTGIGFRRSDNDPCLYVRDGVYIILYVDDILIVGSELKSVEEVKHVLSNEFDMTDLGAVNNFLGMTIKRDVADRVLRISQRSYLESLLERFGMQDCKPVSTPMECHLKLLKGEEKDRTDKPYRELVGCLTYVTLTSRPDLSAAVNYLSQFQSCPTEVHWTHLKRILRYIKGSLDMALEYRGDQHAVPIEAFSDADWANDVNDRRSVTGYAFKIFGCTVAWLTRKQPTVSLSSTEAEFVALCTAGCEGVWMKRLLSDLGVTITGPVVYHEDNQSCILVAKDPRDSRRMKHVDVKYYFIRDLVQRGQISIQYIPSEKQQADILTKGLPFEAFGRLREMLGLKFARN